MVYIFFLCSGVCAGSLLYKYEHSIDRFVNAPQPIRNNVIRFLRGQILENLAREADYRSRRARIQTLISLKYFGALNSAEQQTFDKAIEDGVIKFLGKRKKRDIFSIAKLDF